MNPIIDPMWFYWLSVCDAAKWTCVIIAGIMAFASIVIFPIWHDELFGEEEHKLFKKTLTIVITSTILVTALAVFIPSKQTMIEMQIAKLATYDNAQWTVDSIKGIVDYVIEAVKNTK